MAPRFHVYCRVSTAKQNDFENGHVSLDSQEQACRNWISSKFPNANATVEVVKEVGSAFRKPQPKFLEIVKNAKAGDTVVFYNISRFARNIEKLYLVDKLAEKKVNIQSVAEGCDYSNTAARDLLRIALCLAMAESEQIGDRVRISVNFRRNRGDFIGPVPFGYKAEKNAEGIRCKYEDPAEQIIIKRIADLVRKGTKAVDIAADLNNEGVTKRGKSWTEASVKSILKPLGMLPGRRVSNAIKWPNLVKKTIKALGERGGSSRQAICKAILVSHPNLSADNVKTRVGKICARLVVSGDLVKVKQSFKVKAGGKSRGAAAAKKRATRRRRHT